MSYSLTRDLVSQALRDTFKWDGGQYMIALNRALDQTRPTFESDDYRTAFRERAVDREWFASLLASNTYMEGYSAGRLKQYAGVVGDITLQRNLMRHADDEARHSREFANLIFLVFPHLDSSFLRNEVETNVVDLDAITPCPDDYPAPTDDEIINSLILMNLYEIKALYLGNYLKPFAVAHSPGGHAEMVQSAVTRIARDECYHIAYTARHIDDLIGQHSLSCIADRISGFVDLVNSSDDYRI